MKVVRFWWVALVLLLALFLVSLTPAAGAVILAAQGALFILAGARVADLLAGRVRGVLAFVSAVGAVLVAVALVGAWLPPGLYLPEYLDVLRAVGLVLLVLPLAVPQAVRRDLGDC